MLPENATNFPLEDNNPLSFIDHSLLALIQVSDVYDLNDVLSAFLAEDVIAFVQEHKDMFSVLSGTINAKIRETVFDVKDMTFPDGLLMIPPLFEQLGWENNASDWKVENANYQQKFSTNPCLTFSLALLFTNAMSRNMDIAIDIFKQDIERLPEEDALHAERYLENLQYFGWPAESTSLNIAQQ